MKKIRFWVLCSIPFVLGTIGFMAAGEGVLQAMFQSMQLYLVEYGDPPANLPIEIARWLAPLATAGGVLLAISAMRKRLRDFWLYRTGKTTVVYGPDDRKEPILAELGRGGIDGEDSYVKGHRYILLGSEQDNLSFYRKHREELECAEVYLECSALPAQASTKENLHLFCPEETAAKLFWKQNCFYELSRSNDHVMEIVLLGFGKLGEEVLTTALQYNLFHPQQKITYHVFGGNGQYAATHTQLQEIEDRVVFHDEAWYHALPLLEAAQAVIVLQQADQLALLRSLLMTLTRQQLYVFAAQAFGIEILADRERLSVFCWEEEARHPEHIFGDALYARAKRINLRYAHLYRGVEESAENMQKEWSALDPFTRYSNISAADFYDVQCRILQMEGQSLHYAELDAVWKERLAELEHMRWCRYHYLNNWRFGVPADGSRKDPKLRLHTDLVKFELLTETDKEKDRENIRVLFSL